MGQVERVRLERKRAQAHARQERERKRTPHPRLERLERKAQATLRRLEREASSPWADYHPTGVYELDRPAWELCRIKAQRRYDPQPSLYDVPAYAAWADREARRQAGEALWSLPAGIAEQRSTTPLRGPDLFIHGPCLTSRRYTFCELIRTQEAILDDQAVSLLIVAGAPT